MCQHKRNNSNLQTSLDKFTMSFYGALVVTLAMLLRHINRHFIIIIIIIITTTIIIINYLQAASSVGRYVSGNIDMQDMATMTSTIIINWAVFQHYAYKIQWANILYKNLHIVSLISQSEHST